MQQRGSSDCRKAVLKSKREKRGPCLGLESHREEEEDRHRRMVH
jgi:hypothetical protein